MLLWCSVWYKIRRYYFFRTQYHIWFSITVTGSSGITHLLPYDSFIGMSATGNSFFAQGVEFVNKAIEADNKTEYDKALKLYETSLEYFITGLKHEKNPAAKEMIQKRIKCYMDRAETLKKVLKEQEDQAQQSSTAAAKTKVRGEEG